MYIILVLLAIVIFTCTYLKKKEKREKAEKVARMKIEASHEENLRMTRAKTIQPTASRRLTMGVASSMPSKSPRPGTTK